MDRKQFLSKYSKWGKSMYFLMIVLIISFLNPIYLSAENNIFTEVNRIELKLDQPYYRMADLKVLEDGFVLILDEAARSFRSYPTIIKTDKDGNIVKKYNKRGYGPGELRRTGKIAADENSIWVSEQNEPWIHEFTHSLEFKKDYKIKNRGNIVINNSKFIGIWSTAYRKDGVYMIQLYDKKNLEFKKLAFKIEEKNIPHFVSTWGGICEVDTNTYAGIYCTEFQIRIFDGDFELKNILLKKTPKYVKKYFPWKKGEIFNTESREWMKNWTKMHSIFFIDNHFIVVYMYKEQLYLDVIDKYGNVKYSNYKMPENFGYYTSEGNYLWKAKRVEYQDKIKYYLIKEKSNLNLLK